MPADSLRSQLSIVRQPLLYLCAAFISGIIIESLGLSAGSIGLYIVAALFTMSFAATVVFHNKKPAALLILAAFLMSGFLDSGLERRDVSPYRLKHLLETDKIKPDDPVELTGVLAQPPDPLPDGRLIDVDAETIGIDGQTFPTSGTVRLSISLESEQTQSEYDSLNLDYGSRVRILVRLMRAQTFSNPGSPDFNEFLERRGYDLKGSIKSPLLVEVLGQQATNPVLGFLYHARMAIMRGIDRQFDDNVGGTLKAMLTGNRYFVDARTVTLLREGATFHTLVIAGLHIGIIAWLLLGSRSNSRRRGPVRAAFALIVLWGYTVMVGMAPPVTRTTVMITVAIVGPLLFRRAISINTLALAALVMLAVQPSLISDAGFQLSFVAVAGIVAIAVPFEERLRDIGSWSPSAATPHPPSCSAATKAFCEILFWNERQFAAEQSRANITFRLDKSRVARWVNKWRLQSLARYILLLFLTSTAIQLATLPLMIYYFNRVAPVGLLLNIVSGIFTAIVMIGAMIALALAPFIPFAAAVAAKVVTAAHFLLVNSIVPFLSIPWSTFRAPQYEGPWRIIYALYFIPLLLLAVLVDRWHPVDGALEVMQHVGTNNRAGVKPGRSARLVSIRTIAVAGTIALLIASVVLAVRPMPPSPDGKLTVNFLDVGQGDSALVVFPHGATMLIDAGGEIHFNHKPSEKNSSTEGVETGGNSTIGATETDDEGQFNSSGFDIGEGVVARYLWSRGLRHLDYLLATHAHEDHIGGMEDVLRDFSVGELIVGHEPMSNHDFRRLLLWAKQDRTPIESVSLGRHFEIDGVKVDVLWPQPPSPGEKVTSANNDSVVVRMAYGAVSFLMTGDAEAPAEQFLLREGIDLHADVLKAGHHGSRTSSTEAFISAVNPRYAVVSVGQHSRFGHPNQEVVDRLRAHGIDMLWTGRDGTISASTDGTHLSVKAYLRPTAEP